MSTSALSCCSHPRVKRAVKKGDYCLFCSPYKYHAFSNGIEVEDSYKSLCSKHMIDKLYYWHIGWWKRSKFSLYIEWFIHTLCYRIGYQKDRAKNVFNVFFEYDKSWFNALFKKK